MALKENSLPEDGLEVQESQHRSVAHEFALMDVAREMRDNPASSDVRTPDTNWLPPDLWGTVGETYLDWIFPNSNGHDFLGDPGFMSGSNLADYMPIVDKTAQEPAAKYDSRSRPGDAWPLQWMGSSNQPLEIPAISQLQNLSNRGSFYQIEPLTECGQRSMQNIIRGYLERSPWNTVSLANFPTNEQLDYCIDIFFARFNPAITFIHRPTFNPSKEPVVLILALASIGACFTNIQGVLSFANSISELNRRLLLIMGEQDASTTRTESFIAAQLLQGIQGYCSSDRGLFDLSETYRGSLVHKARNAGFFRDPETEDLGLNPARGDKQWKAWITAERRRRLGWAVYEYDASVSYLYNKRPSVTVGEMMLSLPCDISLWEANSFQAWIALCPRTPDSQSLSFRMTIRSPFEENQEADSNIDNQHKHLITVTLIRFLWSLKEIQGSPIIDLVPNLWPIVEHKRMMLGKLDEYIQSPFAVQDTEIDRNVRILVQRVQLIHLSHLYGAADLMDWLPALIRSVGEHRAATERMICWGAEDPLRLREVAYHAAQILSITRHFPYNLTCEPFNVFYAGAALWCIARLLHKSSADATETAETLYIDRPPRGGEHELDKMNSWIYGRKNFNPAIYGVPSLCSLSGRVHALEQTLQILDNMRTWGIARNFVNVILKLLNVEKAQINL